MLGGGRGQGHKNLLFINFQSDLKQTFFEDLNYTLAYVVANIAFKNRLNSKAVC